MIPVAQNVFVKSELRVHITPHPPPPQTPSQYPTQRPTEYVHKNNVPFRMAFEVFDIHYMI